MLLLFQNSAYLIFLSEIYPALIDRHSRSRHLDLRVQCEFNYRADV